MGVLRLVCDGHNSLPTAVCHMDVKYFWNIQKVCDALFCLHDWHRCDSYCLEEASWVELIAGDIHKMQLQLQHTTVMTIAKPISTYFMCRFQYPAELMRFNLKLMELS